MIQCDNDSMRQEIMNSTYLIHPIHPIYPIYPIYPIHLIYPIHPIYPKPHTSTNQCDNELIPDSIQGGREHA